MIRNRSRFAASLSTATSRPDYHDASKMDQAVAATVDLHTSYGKMTVRNDWGVRQLDTFVTAT